MLQSTQKWGQYCCSCSQAHGRHSQTAEHKEMGSVLLFLLPSTWKTLTNCRSQRNGVSTVVLAPKPMEDTHKLQSTKKWGQYCCSCSQAHGRHSHAAEHKEMGSVLLFLLPSPWKTLTYCEAQRNGVSTVVLAPKPMEDTHKLQSTKKWGQNCCSCSQAHGRHSHAAEHKEM